MAVEAKIAHLNLLQGVISRMASEVQNLKILAVTLAAAVIAVTQGGAESGRIIGLLSIVPTLLFWWMTARNLHVEHVYRRMYELVCEDSEEIELFSMKWRDHNAGINSPFHLAFSRYIAPIFGSVLIVQVVASALSG